MKRIEISVAVRYFVNQHIDVPDDVYEKIRDVYENECGVINTEELRHSKAADFLSDHICQSDCTNCEFEIYDIEEK